MALGLLYKLSEIKFLASLIKPISSLLSQRKFRVSVEGEMSAPRGAQVWVPQNSVLSSALYTLYINGTPQTLGLLADDTCTRMYATGCKEGYVLRKLQRGLSAVETLCKRWNIKNQGR
jgi:hypothetical protein